MLCEALQNISINARVTEHPQSINRLASPPGASPPIQSPFRPSSLDLALSKRRVYPLQSKPQTQTGADNLVFRDVSQLSQSARPITHNDPFLSCHTQVDQHLQLGPTLGHSPPPINLDPWHLLHRNCHCSLEDDTWHRARVRLLDEEALGSLYLLSYTVMPSIRSRLRIGILVFPVDHVIRRSLRLRRRSRWSIGMWFRWRLGMRFMRLRSIRRRGRRRRGFGIEGAWYFFC